MRARLPKVRLRIEPQSRMVLFSTMPTRLLGGPIGFASAKMRRRLGHHAAQLHQWIAAASLARRLLALALIAAVPSLLVLVQNDIYLRQTRLDEANAGAVAGAKHTAAELERMLEGTESLLWSIGEAIADLDPVSCAVFVRSIAPRMPQVK